MLRALLTILLIAAGSEPAWAEVRSTRIPYQHGDLHLEGYLAWDDRITGKRPAILVVHEWWGLNEYVKDRTEQLARLGYLAFALDLYGAGKVTSHPDQAGRWMNAVQADVKVWRARGTAGLEVLRDHPLADAARMAAVGYCFGGATVLQLAYGGAPVRGVVSFHGALPVPEADRAPAAAPKILAAHGNADPFVKEEHVASFREKLDTAGFDWHLVIYAGARHAFTNPAAGRYGLDALQYDERADERSWTHMQMFFNELFTAPR